MAAYRNRARGGRSHGLRRHRAPGADPEPARQHPVTPRAAQSSRPADPTAKPKPKPKPEPEPQPDTKPAALPVAPPSAAALPQTRALPSTTDTAFKNVIHDFWLAVTTGNPGYAEPAFFPEKAYEQVKAISDPDEDWQD